MHDLSCFLAFTSDRQSRQITYLSRAPFLLSQLPNQSKLPWHFLSFLALFLRSPIVMRALILSTAASPRLTRAMRPLFCRLTQDAVVDINGTLLKGLPTIRGGMFETVSKLNTTHFITNVRVNHKTGESTATLTAHALAQHFRTGQGFGQIMITF